MVERILSRMKVSRVAVWALGLLLAVGLTLAPASPAGAAKAAKGKTKARVEAAKSKKTAAKTKATSKASKASKAVSKAKKAKESKLSLEERLAAIEKRSEADAKVQRELDARLASVETSLETDLLERIDAGESLDLEMVGDTYWRSLGSREEKNPLATVEEFPDMPIVGPLVEDDARYELKPFGSRYALLLAAHEPTRASYLPSITPLKGSNYYISSDFGPRKNPKKRKRVEFHGGIDIAGPFKTPIVAAADGIVEDSRSHRGYGNVVWVRHREGLITGYAHMSKRAVKPGQFVSRGDLLGYMGRTGRATGVHLHYMVIHEGRFIDPFPFLGKDLTARLDEGTDLTATLDTSKTGGETASVPSRHTLPVNDLVKGSYLGTQGEAALPEFGPATGGASYPPTSMAPASPGDAPAHTVVGPLAALTRPAGGHHPLDETFARF